MLDYFYLKGVPMHMFQSNTTTGSAKKLFQRIITVSLAPAASGVIAGCYKQEKSEASGEVMQSGDGAT
jgi:hypothetical protein